MGKNGTVMLVRQIFFIWFLVLLSVIPGYKAKAKNTNNGVSYFICKCFIFRSEGRQVQKKSCAILGIAIFKSSHLLFSSDVPNG